MSFVIQDFPLVAIGGVPPYSFSVINDAENTFFAVGGANSVVIISGSPYLHLDATGVYPGVYAVHVRVTDSATPIPNTADSLISTVVDDPSILSILNNDQDFQPGDFPFTTSIQLNANGGVPPYTWSLIPSATTLPGPTITGVDPNAMLNFTLSSYGSFTAGLNVVDAVGNSASTVILYTILNSTLFALVDGQLEVLITVPNTNLGTHHFNATVQDSSVPPNTATGTFYYTALEAYSEVLVPEAFFDHYWGNGDTTAIVFPIQGLGALQGYSLGSPVLTQPLNGLVVSVNGSEGFIKVAGPPEAFRSAQVRIPFQVLLGNTQVALISREYTLLAHSGTTDIGDADMFPRPFIVGDLVGLNPQKPWFNSPSIQKDVNYTTRVQAGSVLPPGLSLDANTGLIYGNVVGVGPIQSVIEYVDATNVVHGTITIAWTIFSSQFLLVNNLTPGLVQQAYTGTISSNSTSALTTVAVQAGALPTGMSVGIDLLGQNVVFSGTPLEAGYFDIWLAVTNAAGLTAYIYVRFVVDFILPLTILTSSLPNFSNQAYAVELQGFGGVTPYVWSLDPTSPALPAGITLSAAGVLSGTYTNAPTAYNQNIIIDLVDSETPALSTSAILNLTYNNTLVITTPSIPIAVPGQPYSFAMQATGGNPPYTWAISPVVNGLTFPTGISFGLNGVFSGVTDETSGTESVTITVTDSSANVAMKTYTLQIGSASGLIIDTADVGPINRGTPYQGHLSVSGPGTAPYSWQIPPSSPNPLPSGLTVVADANTSGVTATISGTYNGLVITNLPVEVEVTDANGQTAFAYMLMSTSSNVIILNTALPAGEVAAPYSVQLLGSGGVPPYTFTLISGTVPTGFSPSNFPSSSGLISGTATVAYPSQLVTFGIADSLTPANMGQKTFSLLIQNTNLVITTTSPLFPVTPGVYYAANLIATGGTPPYVFTVSPNTTQQLPTGLRVVTFSPTVGNVAGITTAPAGAYNVTFRVTDSLGAYSEKVLVVNVQTSLRLQAGTGYAANIGFWQASHVYTGFSVVIDSNGNFQSTPGGTSGANAPAWNPTTGGTTSDNTVTWTNLGAQYLGYVDNGNVTAFTERPNDSFFVVATNVVSTTPSQLGVIVGSSSVAGIGATVISIVSGVAQIQLTGPFAQGALGDNNLSVTVTDSGVQSSATFKWKVYSSGSLRLAPGSGTFPAQVI